MHLNDSACHEEVAGDSEEVASVVGAEHHASRIPDKAVHSVEGKAGVRMTSRGLEGSSRCGDGSDMVGSLHRGDAFAGVNVMAIASVRVHMRATEV
jgi:hypothetical protein